jgi:hypothetical protein
MAKKQPPLPLSVLQAKIENEKLAVLKRTEQRIAEISARAAANSPKPSHILTLLFPVVVLLLYSAYSFSTKYHCQCTCST